MKEKCIRERIVEETSYTNPAKVMNFIKAKKAREVEGFRSVAHYVSHVEAFQKTNLREEAEAKETRRRMYAKLLAQKRTSEAVSERTTSTWKVDQSADDLERTTSTLDLREVIAEKRKALRDFRSFCQIGHRISK
jgi:hypothetical protein